MDVADEYDGGADQLQVGLTQEHLLHAAADCSDEALLDDLFAHHSRLDLHDVHTTL